LEPTVAAALKKEEFKTFRNSRQDLLKEEDADEADDAPEDAALNSTKALDAVHEDPRSPAAKCEDSVEGGSDSTVCGARGLCFGVVGGAALAGRLVLSTKTCRYKHGHAQK